MFIKNILAMTALTLAILGTQIAHAENALGIVIGDPTGLSGRFGLDGGHSAEMALAVSTGRYDGFHIHGTYLWDKARSFATQGGPIDLYYGLGARVITINEGKHDGETAFGPRAPIGLIYKFNNPNLEVFGELAATLDITPVTDVDLDIGIGCRIRF